MPKPSLTKRITGKLRHGFVHAYYGLKKMCRMNTWGGSFEYDIRMKSRYEYLLELLGNRPFESVLDLGCGPQYLRDLLPPSVRYVGVDLHPHRKDSVICDFNKGEFPEADADVCVLGGVLEYIYDPAKFIGHVAGHSKRYVLGSYNFLEYRPPAGGAIWVNSLSKKELENLFRENGFDMIEFLHDQKRDYLTTSGLFLFEKNR